MEQGPRVGKPLEQLCSTLWLQSCSDFHSKGDRSCCCPNSPGVAASGCSKTDDKHRPEWVPLGCAYIQREFRHLCVNSLLSTAHDPAGSDTVRMGFPFDTVEAIVVPLYLSPCTSFMYSLFLSCGLCPLLLCKTPLDHLPNLPFLLPRPLRPCQRASPPPETLIEILHAPLGKNTPAQGHRRYLDEDFELDG